LVEFCRQFHQKTFANVISIGRIGNVVLLFLLKGGAAATATATAVYSPMMVAAGCAG
jgi:hypothetical protein